MPEQEVCSRRKTNAKARKNQYEGMRLFWRSLSGFGHQRKKPAQNNCADFFLQHEYCLPRIALDQADTTSFATASSVSVTEVRIK